MILFIYFFFRILLLVLLNIGLDTAYSQEPAPVKKEKPVPVDSLLLKKSEVVSEVLDSTLKSVEELKNIPKSSERIISINKRLSRKLDHIYYNSILPLHELAPRKATQTVIVFQMTPIRIETDSKPIALPDIAAPCPETKTWFQRINPFRRRK